MKPQQITLSPDLPAWERQPGESPKRYSHFLVYRNLGMGRTLTKAAESLTLAYSHTRNTASQFLWTSRAAAWDAHQTEQYTALLDEERRKAVEADVKILRAMTSMTIQAMPNMDPAKMTWPEFDRHAETTMRLRRQLFGDVTETIAVTATGDTLGLQLAEFAGLSPEERSRRLAVLAAAVTRRVRAIGGSDDEDDDDQGDDGDDGQEDEEEQASQGEDGGEGDGGGA